MLYSTHDLLRVFQFIPNTLHTILVPCRYYLLDSFDFLLVSRESQAVSEQSLSFLGYLYTAVEFCVSLWNMIDNSVSRVLCK